jgi:hypothetical protein
VHRARGHEGVTACQVDSGALDVRDGRDHLRLGAGKIRLSLAYSQFSVRVVDHDENIAAPYILAVDDVHLHHRSLGLGRNLRHLGSGVGIVGAHVAGTNQLPVLDGAAAGSRHGEAEQRKQYGALFLAGFDHRRIGHRLGGD